MTGLITHFLRVLRGDTRYLTKHYDPATTELWERIKLLPDGYPQEIFKQLIVASSAVIDTLVGINQGKRLPSSVDCQTINAEGYRQLYLLLLGYFVFQLMVINPELKRCYLLSLALVCGKSEQQRKLLEKLRRVLDLLPRSDRDRPESAQLSGEVWNSLNQVLKPRGAPKADPGGLVAFTTIAGGALSAALRKVRQQPEVWSPNADLDPRIKAELDKLADYIESLFADIHLD
ncbi:MAG: hypothetical protein ACE5JU_21150 [Candidatus Binatia bacterium]